MIIRIFDDEIAILAIEIILIDNQEITEHTNETIQD